jgi:hypothetical membrane protein
VTGDPVVASCVAATAERRRDGKLVAWGVVGIIAQVLFTAGWLIAETWQGPQYSPVTDTISDLQAATAPHHWFPIACFAIAGLGTFGFAAFGLRPALARAGKVAAQAPWVLACAALAIGNSFPLIPCRLVDPECTPHYQLYSPGGLTDAIVAPLAFLILALTPFPLGRRLAAVPEWRRFRTVVLAARIICPACFLLLVISSSTSSAQGLAERALAISCTLWMGTLAVALIRIAVLRGPGGGTEPQSG